MRLGAVIATALVLAGAACGARAPGPARGDRGKVTYWRIAEASTAFEACTDDPTFRRGFLEGDSLVGAYLTYRVEGDGATAVGLACATTDPDSCVALEPPLIYAIEGQTLSAEGPRVQAPVVGLSCTRESQTDWTLVDGGEDMRLTVVTRFLLAGTATACQVLDESFAALSTNGLGIRDCVVTRTGRGELDRIE